MHVQLQLKPSKIVLFRSGKWIDILLDCSFKEEFHTLRSIILNPAQVQRGEEEFE